MMALVYQTLGEEGCGEVRDDFVLSCLANEKMAFVFFNVLSELLKMFNEEEEFFSFDVVMHDSEISFLDDECIHVLFVDRKGNGVERNS